MAWAVTEKHQVLKCVTTAEAHASYLQIHNVLLYYATTCTFPLNFCSQIFPASAHSSTWSEGFLIQKPYEIQVTYWLTPEHTGDHSLPFGETKIRAALPRMYMDRWGGRQRIKSLGGLTVEGKWRDLGIMMTSWSATDIIGELFSVSGPSWMRHSVFWPPRRREFSLVSAWALVATDSTKVSNALQEVVELNLAFLLVPLILHHSKEDAENPLGPAGQSIQFPPSIKHSDSGTHYIKPASSCRWDFTFKSSRP